MSSYSNQKPTVLDPENIELFSAAGLPIIAVASGSPQGLDRDFKVQILSDGHREDVVSCAIIWLALRVVNFISQIGVQTPKSGTTAVNSPINLDKSGTRPQLVEANRLIRANLQNLVNDWYETLPMTFEPYAVMDLDEHTAVNPKLQRLFFSVPTSAAALLLYHFTQLLLLFNQPVDVESPGVMRLKQHRKMSKEVDFHSRQICGIALGDPSIAVQRQIIPTLCLAGMSLETEEERNIVAQLLRDIGTRTSIATEHLVQGLQSEWA
jgi:hypothetical protein